MSYKCTGIYRVPKYRERDNIMNIEKFRHKRPKGDGYINLDVVFAGLASNSGSRGRGKRMKLKQVKKQSTESL